MSLRISDELAAKANSFPESSYGATTVTLILSDGRRIDDVVLAGASVIVKIGGRYVSVASDLDFSLNEIADVFPSGVIRDATVPACGALSQVEIHFESPSRLALQNNYNEELATGPSG